VPDKPKHTPGPWRPGKAGGSVVCDTPIGSPGHDDHHLYYGGCLIAESIWRERDRDLIAAAPELLKACEWALAALFDHGETPVILLQAIAKAKGES
jgi:hypothetical protein